jgi:hypothetical protein
VAFLLLYLLTIASLPPVSNMRLTNRKSFFKWYAKLKINFIFCNMEHLVNFNALNALHLLFAEPLKLLTIDQIIEQLNVERNTPLVVWDTNK